MKGTSKISRFPRHIREELNRRLDNAEPNQPILGWLNSLPDVQAILHAEFAGEPVKRQNLAGWKASGLRKWQLRQTALQFAADLANDDPGPDKPLTDTLSDKLAQWAAIRYAAAADALANVEEEPQTEMRHLREFCADINTLRRGDLSAGRLALERQRLALLQVKSDEQKDKEFWEWTKRPDVQAKLYPHRDPEKVRRDVDRMLSTRLMGIRYPADDSDETLDPAVLI